jgi:hypothetical protein
MNRTLLAGGCSFTFGNELSDDNGKNPSSKTWTALLSNELNANYFCIAKGGIVNAGIARRVFEYITKNKEEDMFVAVMWTFVSRYDWAMPRHNILEGTRWATITPWDTSDNQAEVQKTLATSEPQLEVWKRRREFLISLKSSIRQKMQMPQYCNTRHIADLQS